MKQDRRAFLTALGVSVPAFAAPEAMAKMKPEAQARVKKMEDIFATYVSTALTHIGKSTPLDIGPQTLVRSLIEAHGYAVATVLADLDG